MYFILTSYQDFSLRVSWWDLLDLLVWSAVVAEVVALAHAAGGQHCRLTAVEWTHRCPGLGGTGSMFLRQSGAGS